MSKKKTTKVGFAERLETFMKDRTMTQQQVAEAAGVSQQAVAKWLNGSVPDAKTLYHLSKTVGCPTHWFFEVIPYTEPAKGELDGVTLSKLPVSAIPPEIRPDMENVFDLIGMEGGLEKLIKILTDELEKRKDNLDNVKPGDTMRVMKAEVPTWPELKKSVIKLTASHGSKAALAKELGVSRQVLGNWLSDDSQGMPNAAFTLELLRRVWKQSGKK